MHMNKVKVIKKDAVVVEKRSIKAVKPDKQKAAREMVSTVTSWVSDFQQRKRGETKVAFKTLFGTPQPSES